MRASIRRLWSAGALLAVALLSCSDLGTDPQTVVALEFDSLPFPAMITGDTMRNAAGVATPLQAVAFNGLGDRIPDAAITYLSLDTGVTISTEGFLRATRRDGSVRLIASAAGLQSVARSVEVTRRPDTVLAPTREVTLEYALPDIATNVAPELKLTLQSRDVAGGVSPNVKGWLVRWRTVFRGDTLAPSDTTLVSIVDAANRRSELDTTKTDGGSSRRLRIRANGLPATVDSFFVIAEVRARGALVPPAPIRFVVRVRPK